MIEPQAAFEDSIPAGYDPQLYRLRHSAAHVLAQAVKDRFSPEGPVRLAIGPPIADGFYYDFDLPRPATDEDLRWLETRMREIITAGSALVRREVLLDEARRLFHDEPYKLELLEELGSSFSVESGGRTSVPLSVYEQDGFTDLCRGPHLDSTNHIDPDGFKLLSVAGAYWRGDEHRPMLQRIYGTAWPTKADLDHYLWQRSEAERRDHRRIGAELELFHFDQSAPGMPYWLPKGLKLLTALTEFWQAEHEAEGYKEISTPILNSRTLWETSGHWDHYKDDMFLVPLGEHAVYGLKPMNCPNAMVVFNCKTRSYRDLPLRLYDCGILHRDERSGTLHGLLRVQEFRQDDAHIFITEDQIEEEFDRVISIADRFYKMFGLTYRLRLGTRPNKFIGDVETWDRAEAALKTILDRQAGPGGYILSDDDGAFYGPKIDILMEDALGRSWQMGTAQLDFQLPRRFNCTYVDRDGQHKTAVVVHRAICGTLERFVGILIEHFEGALPVWLAPIQARIIPIADAQIPHAQTIAKHLRAQRFRVEIDDSRERMQAKIRAAQLQKVPFMLIVGNREADAGTVSVRLRTGVDLGAVTIEEFIALARRLVDARALAFD